MSDKRISKQDRNRIKQVRRFTSIASKQFDFSESDVIEVARFSRQVSYRR